MIIGICGYGFTGSGAVIDLMKEYDDVQVNDDFEFTLTYWPDSIEDLEYHLVLNPERFFSSDMALRRFLSFVNKENISPRGWYKTSTQNQFAQISHDFVRSIIQLHWNGRWMIDPMMTNEFVRTIKYRLIGRFASKNKRINTLLDRPMYFSIEPENFYEASRKYINDILLAMGNTFEKKIVLNQPFAANNPETSMKYYDNAKAIIVDRDPRDIYVLMKKFADVKWAPMDDVDSFIKYFRQLRLHRSQSQDVLYLQFEELIYQYDRTVRLIEKFCELNGHTKLKQSLDPQRSIANTQLFNKNREYDKEIEIIERELHDYLFDFSPYENINTEGTVFL
ncbi:MAG: hypothetical protein K6C08_11980 [Oscillospiraceae bacterium]|nr:hypothetical protein [Oscillospiraceae bacterium]